jgi:4a-hydroxytetrahydrobiopterin dehydratase
MNYLKFMEKLTIDEINQKIKTLFEWKVSNDNLFLIREYKFKNWIKTINFINQISVVAENLNHHPNVSFTYGFCEVKIQTHAVNGITNLDFKLAEKINEISF